MAKRFTDTGKWKKRWYRKLPPKMKAAWDYLCDNCDHAGIWEADFEMMSDYVGDDVTAEECEEHFDKKRFIRISDEKCFLPGFLTFQYGDTIYINNNTHLSALKLLEKNGLTMLVRGPWKIDRTKNRKTEPLAPEEVTADPAQVRALMDRFLKRVPA